MDNIPEHNQEQTHHASHDSVYKEPKPTVVHKSGSSKENKTTRYLLWVAIVQIALLVYIISQMGEVNITGQAIADDPSAVIGEPKEQIELDVEKLMDDDDVLGQEDAAITIVEFSDFECPYCAAAVGTHQALIDRFKEQDPSWEPPVPYLKELAEKGKIKFVFRDFPLSFHQNAKKAAEAAECAGEQGKFWEMHDRLFEGGVEGGVDTYKKYAQKLGLDTEKFDKCLDSGKMAAEIQKDFMDGQMAGVEGTPAFFINGKLISGAQPASVFEQIIASESAS